MHCPGTIGTKTTRTWIEQSLWVMLGMLPAVKSDLKELLVELLLGEIGRTLAAARTVTAAGVWKDVALLARDWRVSPQLLARARKLGADLPVEARIALSRHAAEAFARSAFRAAKALEAIRFLEKDGVRVVAIKGIAAMASLYGKPELRTIYDADLLIEPQDLDAALHCLERQGFARRGLESLEQYQWFVANSPGFGGNQAVTLQGPGGVEIDLHWHVGESLRATEILKRSVWVELMGRRIPVTHPRDGFFLSVRHAIRENLAAEAVCRDLLDVSGWCEALRGCGELQRTLGTNRECRVPALAVTTILRSYEGTGAAAEVAELLSVSITAEERRSARNLGELFAYQLHHGQLSKDVLYLVHSRPWRQIFRGLGRDWGGYRQSMHSMEDSLGTAESWSARASRLARSVPGIRGLQLARELARAKYGES
jgi:hypothetical protein